MEPWEALDIDDSDLSSFLRPCKRPLLDSPPKASHAVAANASQQLLIFQPNSHSPEALTSSNSQFLFPRAKPTVLPHRLIPGPAGVVQAAMQRRALGRQSLLEDAADSIPTQEFIRRVVENGDNNDHDFNTNPWHCALDWLRREGMVDRNSVPFGTPLSSIKKHINIERVGQVIAVIKSCAPNGLGDLVVTLKVYVELWMRRARQCTRDLSLWFFLMIMISQVPEFEFQDPSGTIGASVHRKVFTEGELGNDIKVGSVLVLQKVAVFSPTRSVCYLNITLCNVVKIFSEDSESPSEIYPTALRRTAPSIGSSEKISMPDNASSLPRERTAGSNTSPSLHLGFMEMEAIDKQKGDDKASRSIGGKQDSGSNHSEFVSIADRAEALGGGELEIGMENQSNPYQLGGDSPARNAQNNGSSVYLADTPESHGQETELIKQMEKDRGILIPKNSIPHWTEEQLDELLAFD
ncbi:uncharacterized protein LOC129320564 isoform X1 [Prosopis cineraria]|uniref:uncharacterized protein LOC129320564 isoform X1 n=1 Tax=Prosopis cineraria TaxID=364024 RepID=UPI00240EEAA4|nr:uncharacterized protein LOC129320564 isoform X1 [Prosopis cineraria]XP_054822053.1 uncharacterized protein LOC129320564 isoform X1 [Prosopis cineraria]